MDVTTLGEARFASPLRRSVSDRARLPVEIVRDPDAPRDGGIEFELAGPRARIFFDPAAARAGIVTCGGLCPGLNNVVRSIFLELHHSYGVREVLGFRDGYRGLDPARAREPVALAPDFVDDIHKEGGTVLGTSRGPVDTNIAVDELIRRKINMLFVVGGDGTQRGGNDLFQEARRRGYPLAVVGVPKTIDNDVAFVSRTFGFLTAVEEAAKVLHCAHTEAHSTPNGIALVKLMGRHAGFIAAGATIASQDVNFCLVPEIPFKLEGEGGFLAALKRRILTRGHALVVVAEGAGQDLFQADVGGRDASGNVKLGDIGLFLRERIASCFKADGIDAPIRYFDPSYIIRSVPADSEDAVLCDLYARNAVHAAMAGKTGLVIGCLHDHFVHVPIEMLARQKKCLDPDGPAWHAVLATTGQPPRFC
ncbi:MAG: ATP-dependent 6-phosphofructokinase [Verrucomicrobiae bacterium]|nr:ATP-dependent 6-phosphofructokinase [Verrucomicrobiae bacterium]